MKNAMLLILFLIAASVVFVKMTYADTNVSIGVESNESVNLGVGVNATGNVNVTIDGTNIGEQINELNNGIGTLNNSIGDLNGSVGNLNDTVSTMYTDVYGSSPNTPDHILQGAENATDVPLSDYCSDPELSQYFSTFSSIPPAGFKDYVKSLGYDDEVHINLIWTICQEKRLNSMNNSVNSMNSFVSSSAGGWSTDTGIYYPDVVGLIQKAVDWLLGKNKTPTDNEKTVATALDSYFASDADVNYLLLRTQDLNFRVSALEKTMDRIAADSYCQGKLDVMKEYNLEAVSCGNTTYHNHMVNPLTGEDMIIQMIPQ